MGLEYHVQVCGRALVAMEWSLWRRTPSHSSSRTLSRLDGLLEWQAWIRAFVRHCRCRLWILAFRCCCDD